jgi:NADH-quinone oxidoreductase subunit N
MTDLSQLQPLVDENLRSALWFRPEAALTVGTMVLFVLDLFWKKDPKRVGFLTAAALGVLAVAAGLLAVQPTDAQALFNGMLANDGFASFFKWLFLGAAALTVLITAQGKDFPPHRVGEFYALLMAIVLGMFMMASATDLLMMYLAIELVSMVSYVLAGFKKGDRKAAEGSLKYVIYGGVASGVMLFGMSYLYGLTGTTSLLHIGHQIQAIATAGFAEQTATRIALVVAVVFVATGLGYKVAAVPFHMWCPDVYEGAPTPFTAFLSVGPKAAGFALALRFFLSALAGPADPITGFHTAVGNIPWPAVIGVVSAVTMTLGNLTALAQTNLKRLLAYSSIAHAGYTLMGLAAVSTLGVQAVMIYMLIYVVMNLGAFLVVIWVAENTGSESILDYKGLAKRQPLAAVTFAVFLFSLTGLPPFAGFAGKWYLFYAVFERIGNSPYGAWYGALALIGALNTAVSLYYYVRIIRAMFIDAPYAAPKPLTTKVGYQLLLGAFTAAILVFGLWWSPIIAWTSASLQLFRG